MFYTHKYTHKVAQKPLPTCYLTRTTTMGRPQLPLLPNITNDIIYLQTECLLNQQLSIAELGQWARTHVVLIVGLS